MEFRQPSPDEPELFDWWRPLLAASCRARDDRMPWPIHIDEFQLFGCVERTSSPAIWIYEHRFSGGKMLADWKGRTYEFVPYRTGRQPGRFKEIDVRRAIWRAGLPDVVDPVEYEYERRERMAESGGHTQDWVSVPQGQGRPRLFLVSPPTNLN